MRTLVACLVVLLVLSANSAWAQQSTGQSPSAVVDDQQNQSGFSDQDCARLNLLFDAMCQRTPEIQFFLQKLDPSHEGRDDEIARSVVASTDGDSEHITYHKEFWNQCKLRYHGCSLTPGNYLGSQLAIYIQRKFPNWQKLNSTELTMLRNMCRYQCERLASEYQTYSKYTFPREIHKDTNPSEWRNVAASARQSLCNLSGADAVATMEESFKAEKNVSSFNDGNGSAKESFKQK